MYECFVYNFDAMSKRYDIELKIQTKYRVNCNHKH